MNENLPTAVAKRVKRTATIDYAANTVTLDSTAYAVASLPADQQSAIALHGLRSLLLADDGPALFGALVAGNNTLIKKAKTATLDAWREAAAHVHALGVAEANIRAAGYVQKPGRKLVDSPEFAAEFAQVIVESRAEAAGWTKEQLATAKQHPGIVAQHNQMTGVHDALAALFVKKATAE